MGWTKMMMAKDGKLPKYAGGALGNVLGATASGATVGSALGPVGAIAGGAAGLFGSILGEASSVNKQRENKRIAEANIAMGNNARQNEAIGKGMQLYTAQRYGDQYDQSLFGHANGKLPKYNNGNLPPYAFTEYGLMLGLKPNAMGAPGETMTDGNGNDLVLPGKPSNNDVLPIYASGKTTIVTNKKGLSKYYQKTGDLAGVQNAMAYYKQHGYKNGKMPGFAEDWLGNAIPFGLGSIASLAQYIDAKNSTPYRPNTYAANPYETRGLATLAGLRINPYPITQQLRNAEARTNRAIDIAGGLSGSQRTAARLANLNTTQNNISNLLSNIQQQNNAYKSKYAEAALQAGQQARTARMAANQWDLDMYAKAHAARNRGIQTGIANMLSQIQQYQANEFKRRQFNETMDLYRDDMDQRKKNFEWMANQSTRGVGADPATNNPTTPLYGGQSTTYFGRKDLFGVEDWLQKYRDKYNAWRNSLPASLRYRGGIG